MRRSDLMGTFPFKTCGEGIMETGQGKGMGWPPAFVPFPPGPFGEGEMGMAVKGGNGEKVKPMGKIGTCCWSCCLLISERSVNDLDRRFSFPPAGGPWCFFGA